ncbi:MAG: phosphoribosylaminoimidazolesuccinocarboxamide synthase, partial [Verrucomicrobiota bacterium]
QPWNKTAPGPTLPADVVQKTQVLYAECLERLTA